MAALMPNGRQQYFDANGDPLAGGKVHTFAAGTSTPLATYTTAAGNIANTNPVILDARGEAAIFWGRGSYKVALKDSNDVEIWTQDDMKVVADPMKSIYDFGAVGDGVADDTDALNDAASYVGNVWFPAGVFTTTTGVALVKGCRWLGAGNWSGVASTDSTTGNTVIKYIGAGGANSCVVRIAAEIVGVEPTTPSTRDMQNIAFTRFTIDGNQLAEFGLYTVRAWSNNILDFVTVTGTTKHAFYAALCWNGSPRNWHAFKNIGCGITLGRNIFSWSNATVDQSTCISFFGYYSGVNSSTVYQNDFSDSTDTEKEYGIGLYGCRAVTMINAQGQECGGAGVFIKTTLSPVQFIGGYFENNGKSSGSTKEWAIWVEGAATGDSWFIDFDGTHLGNGPAVKLTGTEPSRLEAGVVFRRMPFLGEIVADWDNYRLIDCDRGVTITGTAPTNFGGRINTALNLMPIGVAVFDATSGAVSILNKEGVISGITYSAVGTYVVAFSETFSSVRYVAQVTGGDNRVIGLGSHTASGFTIFNRSTAGALVDTNTSRVMVTVWGYYV